MATVAGRGREARSARALRWSARLLMACRWCSGAIFGAYILTFFDGAALRGEAARWNGSLANLHDPAAPLATLSIGAHFATGGVLLLLGPLQLIGALRRRRPALHRWVGRLYVLCAGVAGLGGLGFILSRGTIGGAVMSTGFALYGASMASAAALTFAAARAGRAEAHRGWAIRLFALTVGSWLYRMEYGAWFLAIGCDGHTADFRGGFDQAMAFLFYLPTWRWRSCSCGCGGARRTPPPRSARRRPGSSPLDRGDPGSRPHGAAESAHADRRGGAPQSRAALIRRTRWRT